MWATAGVGKSHSKVTQTAAGIPVGRAVARGTAPDGANLVFTASTGNVSNNFIGVSLRDTTLNPSNDRVFPRQNMMRVAVSGEVYVEADGAVTEGAAVTFETTGGKLGAKAASSTSFSIPGAVWASSATTGEIAKVYLSGHLPAK